MDMVELARELKKMYNYGKKIKPIGSMTQVHLFGIKYSDEIKNLIKILDFSETVVVRDIVVRAGLHLSLHLEIIYGMKLSEYVILRTCCNS